VKPRRVFVPLREQEGIGMKSRIFGKVLTAVLLLNGAAFAADPQSATVSRSDADLTARITHEIAVYPLYSMWDIVSLKVRDGRVALSGAVTLPGKKDDIEKLVKDTPGVTGVESEINVLPPSNEDDRLRQELARAIYSDPAMATLRALAPPPIHIIVENGHVTLAGAVESELQKTVAGMRASAVGMTFGPVVNNLVVADLPAKKKA
jgi:hyperosmotically inducible protein